ncbi:MAG TPA: bifunctional transaldolase/phosoglucose isomerase [Chloroflexota bacterium]|nr:bifunctional transaldolase/phosoglucose isomerase [Chloroflexota bacterium]
MKLMIAADHAGFPLKESLKRQLQEAGHTVEDLGTHSAEPVDYPDYARKLAERVVLGRGERGIFVCGSGQGGVMATNKIPGVRAALAQDTYSARQSVEHDDANVLCLGARVLGDALAWELTRAWLAARFSGEERHCRRLAKLAKLDTRFPLLELHGEGQSAWVDNIRRGLLETGEFRRMVREGITGVTSNPTILEKAVSGSTDYEAAMQVLARQELSPREIAIRLWIDDIREAADQLRPIYDLTERVDGYASIEVDAELALKTEATIEEGRRLWREVDRPNVMIKVPATPPGIPAIRQLIAEGINVNITLLFSQQRYEEVMEAYLAGLEERAEAGRPVDHVASVASFFVSRVDTAVDKQLEAKIQSAADAGEREALQALLGKAAIANAKLAYQRFLKRFGDARWQRLAAAGAMVQRPLWASTSTKNPAYRDVLYVEELIGPDTINTMPPATIEAFKEHGLVRRSVDEDVAGAQAALDALARHGVDLDAVTEQLQDEGVAAFAQSFDQLLAAIADKRAVALKGAERRVETHLGPIAADVERAARSLAESDAVRRIWAHDAALWGQDALAERNIANRLGWMPVVETMQERVDGLRAFADEVRAAGFRRAVLLGMGGSSLAPEVLRQTFGAARGYLDLDVLDTTDPATLLQLERSLDLDQTLFVVASKSGTTVETLSQLAYFWAKTNGRGDQFIAITDGGTPLEALARERGFRRVFVNPGDIGGRYSALSYFGLVPGALLGVDLTALLDRAARMAEACRPGGDGARAASGGPGAQLGAILGASALAGRDKITLVLPDAIAAFGDWVEQLLAESTGKQGKGLVPVVGEPLGAPGVYGNDRLFVALTLEGEAPNARLAALQQAGQPVVTIPLRDTLDLGGEFFRWEFATAVAGVVLGINPFDEPNVQESKDNTKRVLEEFQRLGRLPEPESAARSNGLAVLGDAEAKSVEDALASFLDAARPGDYLALQAYLPYRDTVRAALEDLRLRLRDRLRLATTFGFGPRFLHSTGQLHKGGPPTGLFLQFSADDPEDVPIPGQSYTFGTLKRAQALGDLQALQARGRPVRAIRLHGDLEAGLRHLAAALDATAARARR